MPSDIENQLRVLQVKMDAFGVKLEEALAEVPAALREDVRRLFEERRPTEIAQPAILPTGNDEGDWWNSLPPDSQYYWPRLKKWLIDKKGRHPDVVRNLDAESTSVVRRLGDPRNPPEGSGQFRVQGLVVGYVQSGKTANFTATIAKAADSGYRFVVVLSGIHNTLRRQTQQRLELELGMRPDRKGVPAPEPGRAWMQLTSPDLNGDFRGGTTTGMFLQSGKPILAVVKKNGPVLRRLLDWIGDDPPRNLPVLIIDDEADQASVNTGGNQVDELSEDDRPSRINSRIRELIGRFQRVSYIAYTATPFANVFINPDGIDREALQDLYPKDFIVALDKPHGYVGTEDLFGRAAVREEDEKPSLDVIVPVDDGDVSQVVVPRKRRVSAGESSAESVESFRATMPASMEQAIQDFVLAGAGLLARHEPGERAATPLTMLIHSSHAITVHQELGAEVMAYVDEFRRDWRYDRKRSLLQALKTRWDGDFKRRTLRINARRWVPFATIEPLIGELLRELRVKTVNSQSEDVLDYELMPGVKAIVVGGNRLSRGLTLENLLVSYFVRQTPVLDTLLQMGRWFGHRSEYVDLTRLYTTRTLIDWFREVAAAEDELRDDIRLYAVTNRTPLEFGPRVRSHAILRPTAANKMQHAQEVNCSFAGQLKQTIVFRLNDARWLEGNLDATRALVRSLGTPRPEEPPERPRWYGASADLILSFLGTYQTNPESTAVDASELASYVRAQNAQRELLHWDVAIIANEKAELGLVDLGLTSGKEVNLIGRSRLQDTDSIGILVNPAVAGADSGDEVIGMLPEEIQAAKLLQSRDSKLKYGRALRKARDRTRGLLLIYPISPLSVPKRLPASGKIPRQQREPLFPESIRAKMPPVIGIGVVFPDSDSAATEEYLVGPAGASEDA